MLLKYFLGDDIFISYTRSDGMTYAAGLANQLAARDFSCFLDQWGTPPGRELPAPLKRALSRSTILVLIGSEGVTRSDAVARELKAFRKTGRTIVPIDFGGALERAPWFDDIAGLARTPESVDALETGEPSSQVLARIDKSFHFTRRNQRARRSFVTAAAVLLLLAGISVYTMDFARKEATRAQEQSDRAEANRRSADEQAALAEKNRQEAERRTAEAREQEKIAKQQEQIAREQERWSRSRALAASASAQLPIDPAQSLDLATQAWSTQPTDEARVALRDALLQSHVRFVVSGHTGSADAASFNADGSLVVLAVGDIAKVLDVRTEKVLAELRGHTKTVRSAVFSQSDDGLIVTGAEDSMVRIWRWRSARPAIVLEEPGPSLRARFSPDGRFVLVTTADDRTCSEYRNYGGLNRLNASKVRVWDVRAETWVGPTFRGACFGSGRGYAAAAANAFTPDGRFIFFACVEPKPDEDVSQLCTRSQVRDLATGRSITLEGDARLIEAVVSEKAGIIVGRQASLGLPRVSIQNRPFQIWDLTSGAATVEMVTTIERMTLSSGTPLVTAYGRNVYLWDFSRKDENAPDPSRPTASRIFNGHTGAVESIAVSADSRFIVSAAEDRTARVWDIASGKTVAVLRGHTDRIERVAMTRDFGNIVTSSADGTARIWSAGMAKPIVDLAWTEGEVRSATFAPDGGIVAADKNRVRTWHPMRGERQSTDLQGTIKAIRNDGQLALVSDPDYSAWVYSMSGDRLLSIQGQRAWFRTAAFAAQGQTIVTAAEDGQICLWNAATGALIKTLSGARSSIPEFHVSGNGRRIVLTIGNEATTVFDAATGATVATLGKTLGRARLDRDGTLALTLGAEGLRTIATVWDVDSGTHLVDLSVDDITRAGHRQQLMAGSISPDGRRIVTIDPYAAVVWTISKSDGRSAALTHVLLKRPDDDGGFRDAEFSPDGRHVVTAQMSGVLLWDAATGNRLFTLNANERSQFARAAFSADDRLIATLMADGALRIWERENGGLLHTLRAEAHDLASIGFSPDSTVVFAGTTASSDETFAWRVADGRRAARFRGHNPVISPRSDRLLTISRSESVQLWRAGRERAYAPLTGLNGLVVHADFSNDGRHILTVTTDFEVQVWDAASGRQHAASRAHRGIINHAAFTRDGATVMTASNDGTALLWNWQRNSLTTLREKGPIARVVVSPDHRWVATAHLDQRKVTDSWSTRLWRVPAFAERSPAMVTDSFQLHGRPAQFSPDGSQLLTIGDDQTVRIWNAADHRLVVELRGHGSPIEGASFSPDARYVVTASNDGSARVWESATGALISDLLGHFGSHRGPAAFSPDGERILTKSSAVRLFACVICGTGKDLAARALARRPPESAAARVAQR